jgi:hypothetical protein
VATNYVDLKRDDAIELLQTIRNDIGSQQPAGFDFARTAQFDTLYNRGRVVSHGGVELPLESIATYAALHDPTFDEINFHALNRAVIMNLAVLLGMDTPPTEVDTECQRFRRKHDLESDGTFTEWLRNNDLSREEFWELMEDVWVCRRLHRWLLTARWMERNTKHVLDELRLRNTYAEWAERAASQERLLQSAGLGFRQVLQGRISTEELLEDHQEWTDFRLDIDPSAWAEEAGFHNMAQMQMELYRAMVARATMLRRVARLLDDPLPSPGAERGTEAKTSP